MTARANHTRGSTHCTAHRSDAITVAHRLDGDAAAAPLVLSNSLGTAHAIWKPQLAELSRHHGIIRYDNRGQGASPTPPGPYQLAELAQDALALLDNPKIEQASFCRLSIGDMVGMWLAAHHPDRIDRLIIICSSPKMPPASAWAERAAVVRQHGSLAPIAVAVSTGGSPRTTRGNIRQLPVACA